MIAMHAADKAPASRTPLATFLSPLQVAPRAPVHVDDHDLCTREQASGVISRQQWASHESVCSITALCKRLVRLSEQPQESE